VEFSGIRIPGGFSKKIDGLSEDEAISSEYREGFGNADRMSMKPRISLVSMFVLTLTVMGATFAMAQ